jgi:hypothetical protein
VNRYAVVVLASLLAAAGTPANADDQLLSIDAQGDVRPGDWAYRALADLGQQNGCRAAMALTPGAGSAAQPQLSRFEAAALLQTCLERVQRPTDAMRRLMVQFADELEQLKGRRQQVSQQIDSLSAQTFSATTRLSIESIWVAGGNSYGGNAINTATNSYSITGNGTEINKPLPNGVSFNYDLRLNLSTSWTGKDLLYTRLRSGNFFPFSGFGNYPDLNMAILDAAFGNGPSVRIDRLYYRFPIGNSLSVMVGPRLRNTEILGFRPQAYDGILDFFTLAGAPTVYNKNNGAGAGFSWKQPVPRGKPYWIGAVSYVARFGEYGDPELGGLFNSNSGNNVNLQLGGRGDNWALAAGYRYGTCSTDSRSGTTLVMAPATLYCNTVAPGNDASSHSISLGGYWQPRNSGWLPAISLGWGYSHWNQSAALISDPRDSAIVSATQSWAAMLQWNNVAGSGNAAGLAVGQGTMATALRTGATPADNNVAVEGWYRFRVSDAITVTPAFFYLANPLGQVLAGQGQYLNNLGLLIQTRFVF